MDNLVKDLRFVTLPKYCTSMYQCKVNVPYILSSPITIEFPRIFDSTTEVALHSENSLKF